MSAPTRAFDPAGDPMLTVRCSPEHKPDSPYAVLAIRVDRGPLPWLVITGPETALPLTDDEVAHWPVAHPATWSPQLARDLAHLHNLARKDTA